MKQLTLPQQYAVLALDGQMVGYSSVAKGAALRCLKAAQVLEEKNALACSPAEWEKQLQKAAAAARKLKRKAAAQLEGSVAASLRDAGLLEEIPDLLGCDINYYTSGVSLKAYRCREEDYLGIREGLRAEILESGEITRECAVLLWLLRESGCIHDCFSTKEQQTLQERMTSLAAGDGFCRLLWETECHSPWQLFALRFLQKKHNLFRNPYLEGVNLVFPFLERRKAIFIDFSLLGTDVAERRAATVAFLREQGHRVEEVKSGTETLLKVENAYYRIFPGARRVYKLPVQGVNLVPVYW